MSNISVQNQQVKSFQDIFISAAEIIKLGSKPNNFVDFLMAR
jgi:hypothetical protein